MGIKKSLNNWMWMSVVALTLLSCGERPLFDASHAFTDRTWHDEETVEFDLEVTDTLAAYDFVITLRTTTDYAYSNLWVYISSTAPDNVTSKIAQRINIARPDGTWIGRVSGSVVESKLIYRTQPFPYSGNYTFSLELATQQEKIKEILDISLRIEKHKG
jgi:gliding motility-associated lipoprotein GldH